MFTSLLHVLTLRLQVRDSAEVLFVTFDMFLGSPSWRGLHIRPHLTDGLSIIGFSERDIAYQIGDLCSSWVRCGFCLLGLTSKSFIHHRMLVSISPPIFVNVLVF